MTFIHPDINILLPSNFPVLTCNFAVGQETSSSKDIRKIWKSRICTMLWRTIEQTFWVTSWKSEYCYRPDQEIVGTSWWSEVKPEAKHGLLVRSCGNRFDLTIRISLRLSRRRKGYGADVWPVVERSIYPLPWPPTWQARKYWGLETTQDLHLTPSKVLQFILHNKQTRLPMCFQTSWSRGVMAAEYDCTEHFGLSQFTLVET